jgi:hypothetical protein
LIVTMKQNREICGVANVADTGLIGKLALKHSR